MRRRWPGHGSDDAAIDAVVSAGALGREAITEPLSLAPPARRRPPWVLVIGSALIAAALLLPVVFLLLAGRPRRLGGRSTICSSGA